MKLGFIGTGNMAGAIMGGVIKSNVFKPEEIIGTSAVLRFHLAVILHIRDQNIDQFVVVLADLAKSHRIIEETAVLIMSRKLFRMEIYDRLSHIGEVKLNAGIICNHQA